MTEEDDTKLDIEAMNDKAEELKKLDGLSFSPDDFEDIEREFKQFLEEIVGNTNLRTFKEKYQQKYNTLKSSYEKEVKTLRQCKQKINEIWENAQNVRSAIRMANNEVDKIAELKQRVDEETAKVNSRKEEEKARKEQIAKLQEQIEEALELASQPIVLEQDHELKELRKVLEELDKQKDEQEEKQEIHRAMNKRLMAQRLEAETAINAQHQKLAILEEQINKA